MTMRLDGRVALVTGGLRGIGRAIVQRLAAEGAVVVITDLADGVPGDDREWVSRLGRSASYRRLDVSIESDWTDCIAALRAQHGRLDVLVNNAGVDCTGTVESLSYADWRRIMSTNVDGVFLGTKASTLLLAESGASTPFGGSLINVSSIMGIVGFAETAAYNASKGAVRLFTKAIAVEFAQRRLPIRANALCPGFVRTPLLEIGMRRWVEQGKAASPQQLIDGIAAATPAGRIADAADIAAAACFLASDDSGFCIGSDLIVDGGWTAQ